MMQRILVCGLVACLWFGVNTTSTMAEMINLQFSNFPLHYGNQDISDAASHDGGAGDVAKASPLGPLTVSVNGDVQATYPNGAVLGDLLITGVNGLADTGFSSVVAAGPVNGFGLDLLELSGEKLLSLNLDKPEVYYYSTPFGQPVFMLTGGVATINEQHLPNGITLTPGDTVTFTLNGTEFANLMTSNHVVTGFDTSTVGSVSGNGSTNGVPEPSTWALLLVFGVASLAGRFRRLRCAR
jgi:hypothetical protein